MLTRRFPYALSIVFGFGEPKSRNYETRPKAGS